MPVPSTTVVRNRKRLRDREPASSPARPSAKPSMPFLKSVWRVADAYGDHGEGSNRGSMSATRPQGHGSRDLARLRLGATLLRGDVKDEPIAREHRLLCRQTKPGPLSVTSCRRAIIWHHSALQDRRPVRERDLHLAAPSLVETSANFLGSFDRVVPGPPILDRARPDKVNILLVCCVVILAACPNRGNPTPSMHS